MKKFVAVLTQIDESALKSQLLVIFETVGNMIPINTSQSHWESFQ